MFTKHAVFIYTYLWDKELSVGKKALANNIISKPSFEFHRNYFIRNLFSLLSEICCTIIKTAQIEVFQFSVFPQEYIKDISFMCKLCVVKEHYIVIISR